VTVSQSGSGPLVPPHCCTRRDSHNSQTHEIARLLTRHHHYPRGLTWLDQVARVAECQHLEDECQHLEDECQHLEDDCQHLEDECKHLEDEYYHVEDECMYLGDEYQHTQVLPYTLVR